MSWPLMRRRKGVDRARYEQVVDQRDEAVKEAADHVEKIAELCGDINGLREELAAARKRLAAYNNRRTVSDVLEEHDVHRKALADALGQQKRHLNWKQLIAEVERLGGVCEAWMADHKSERDRADRAEAELAAARKQGVDGAAAEWRAQARREKKRADQLQKQYDDAVGMNTGRGDRGLHGSEHWKPPIALEPRPKGAVS